MQRIEGADRHVEPCDGDVRGLANLECHTPQLEQIRGRGEPEIQIDATVQVGHDLAVERPDTIGRPRDPKIERACTQPCTTPSRVRHSPSQSTS